MKFKRGQDLTIGTLVLIALGVVVLVLLVLGFWKGWDFVFGFFDLAGDTDLDAVVQRCAVAAQAGLTSNYCSFVKISYQGQTEYVNCVDGRIKAGLADKASSITTTCDTEKTAFCTGSTLSVSQKTKVKVNGGLCPPQNLVEAQ